MYVCMYAFFLSVTQRANHARDYLLGEGLEKIDGYVNFISQKLLTLDSVT